MARCKLNEIPQGQVWGSVHGAGWRMWLGAALGRTWGCWWMKSFPWPGHVKPKKTVLGCIQSSLSSWAREGILPPYSAFAVPNSRTWTCWRKSRGGHNEEQRAGWPLLCRQAETIWFIQSGEEKATGRTLEHLLVPKGDLRESLRGTLLRAWSDKRSGNIFKLKSLDLVLRRYFCSVRVVRHWSRWPREVGGAPPLEALKRRLNGALNNLI